MKLRTMIFSRREFCRISSAAAMAPLLPRFAMGAFATGKEPQTAALCRKLRSDPMRPQFHLLPASNWMNDPNGPIFWRGKYHMFHQYNPQGAIWGNMNWAHASSPDMVYWRHEPIALAPTPGGYDRDGVFSGSAVVDHGTPVMIYTGVMPPAADAEATLRDGKHTWREVQCMAVSQDSELRTWRKLGEPILPSPPPGVQVNGFRDPYVWREGDSWMLALGSGFKNKGGAVLLYRSPDLRHWTYLHPLLEGSASEQKTVNAVDNGEMWECPDFFPLGNKHVLLVSTMGKVIWKVGTYQWGANSDQRFTPEKEGVADWGAYYAAKTMLDRDGNRILWGWVPETRPEAEHNAAGWAGVMGLPRVLSLNSENDLQMEVVPAMKKLRDLKRNTRVPAAPEARKRALDALRIHDLSVELQLDCKALPHAAFTLRLETESGESFATIGWTNQAGGRELRVNDLKAPFPGDPALPVRLRLFLDGSVLEVFANGTTAVTARVYQAPSGPLRLRLEGDADIAGLQVWQIKPISNDRLTGSLCD